MKRKFTAILLVLCMVLSMYSTAFAVVGVDPPKDSDTFVITSIGPSLISPGPELISEPALDYSDAANWAYFEEGQGRPVDLFLICPTVDTRSETNSFDLNDKLKGRFVNALDMERGIYENSARMFSPYYRQMSMNAYRLDKDQQAQARAVAYNDISAAFRWYLDNENGGRGFILAGFSQGSDMCLELLKEYFGGDSAEAMALRSKLIAVYSIGWSVTEEMAAAYPQIVPAKGETDTGVVISFDCEDGSLDGTLVNPAGTRALSINPLNWKTDGTKADKALNKGAVMSTGAEPQPALCGAYIGSRGELVVTDVAAADYPAAIDIFPEGSYHVYDYMFFFENLRKNVAARTAAWQAEHPFRDVADGLWYSDAVKFAYEKGLMEGSRTGIFNPDKKLTRAQLATVLWRIAGEPYVNYALPYSDVPQELWYSEAVRWAAAEKITDRISGGFGPNEPISREETAEMFFRMARHQGLDLSIDDGRARFSDEGQISDRYRAAINWAVSSGLMEGSNGKLDPKGELSRAQASMLLQRFFGIIYTD